MIRYTLLTAMLLFSASLYANEPETGSNTDNKSSIDKGAAIYNSVCADACHQAPAPGRLNSKQWRVVLNNMQTRMKSAGRVPLTEEQTRYILDYLTQPE